MFKPLHNRALVKPDKHERERTTASGIILLKNEEKPITGTVVVGNSDVKEGQRVLFSKYGYDETQIDGELHYVVSDLCILGIFE